MTSRPSSPTDAYLTHLTVERRLAANSVDSYARDLVLLALQLQIEQIDASHAAQVTSEQVRHFNKVLAEQLAELEAEINGRQDMLCMSYGLAQSRRIDPLKLDAVLRSELRDVEAANKQLDHERRMLRGDPTLARAYLKQERQMRRMLDDRFRF